MERYKERVCGKIGELRYNSIDELDMYLKTKANGFIVNRNENGKIHSNYVQDRYLPAIVEYSGSLLFYYYIFDGDIVDCEHPFMVAYKNWEIFSIIYYSSKRIQNNEPIILFHDDVVYNAIDGTIILDEYEYKETVDKSRYWLNSFNILCEEMNFGLNFKFAD